MPEHGLQLLPQLVATYAIALVFILALARLGVPPIVAFIIAGMVAGPTGIAIVETQEEVNLLADLGIVLLLFTVGLEFSLSEIRRIWKAVVFGGSLQIAGTAALLMLLMFIAAQESWRVSLFIGLFAALSSTAIVLRELGSRNQLDAPHGRLMVGVLLFQDLAIVGLLLLVPILSGKTALSGVPLVLLRAAAAIGAVAVVSRLVLPVLFRLVAQSGRREAFPLAVMLASIGTAWVSSLLGISMALGAFLGGWQAPIDSMLFHWLPPFGWFLLKVFVIVSMFLWIRATFPRYRYDQIMRLGWKVFIPLTLVWIAVIGLWMQTPWNLWP